MRKNKYVLLLLDDNGSIVSAIEDLIDELPDWEIITAYSILECYDIIKEYESIIDFFLCDSNMDQSDLPEDLQRENASSIYTGFLWFSKVIIPEFPEFISKYAILSAYVEEIKKKYGHLDIKLINKNDQTGGLNEILYELSKVTKRLRK